MQLDKSAFASRMLVVLLFVVCCCSCYYSDKQANQKIEFYYRDEGGINGYNTYFDNFKITNYSNKSVLASDLFSFAKKYIDTVHSDKPVSHITFTGETTSQSLPKPSEDYFNTGRKQALLWFGFDNNFPQNAKKRTISLSNLRVWEDEKSKIYEYSVPSGKRVIDSILNSKQPFDNDF